MAGVLLGVALAVALAWVVDHRLGPKHLLTVAPSVLYRSATLPPEQLDDVIDRYGIRTVVNLRSQLENDQAWHSAQAQRLHAKGVRLVDLPINSGFPPSSASLEGWLELLDDSESHPILVHCEYGVVRTGVMVAVYQMEVLGRSGVDSWQDFELFGGELRDPIRSRIGQWITHYEPGKKLERSTENR
jgi:protein tyrosine/serine phosphatase